MHPPSIRSHLTRSVWLKSTHLNKVRGSCLFMLHISWFVSCEKFRAVSLHLKVSYLAPNAEECLVFFKQPSGAKHHVTVSADQFPLHLVSKMVFIQNEGSWNLLKINNLILNWNTVGKNTLKSSTQNHCCKDNPQDKKHRQKGSANVRVVKHVCLVP